MSQSSFMNAPSQLGAMTLIMPEDGDCHQVVGRSLEAQKAHQRAWDLKILTGGKGSLPKLPGGQLPGPRFWNELRCGVVHKSTETPRQEGTVDKLAELLRVVPIGRAIIAHLWYVDTPSVGNLASASKACSDAAAIYISRFHLPNGDYQDCDWYESAHEEMAEGRRTTIGIGRNLYVRGRDHDAMTSIKDIPSIWATNENRGKIWDLAQDRKNNFDSYSDFVPFIMNLEKLVELENKIHQERVESCRAPLPVKIQQHHLLETNYNVPMLRSLHQYGANLKAIRLDQVPMLDVRMVDLILSTCPKLEVMGVINCELLHFSDIIPLLDLVKWNSKQLGKLPVKLDFMPRTYFGPPKGREGTFIISWDPVKTDPCAVLMTTLLAVLKALPMGLDLVSKDQPFRKFLDMMPMAPGTTAVFLHHLFIWVDAQKDTWKYRTLPREVQEHLENQVLLAALQGVKYPMQHYLRNTYFKTYNCCECGYDLITPFFPKEMGERRDDLRVCRICMLRYALIGESHHRLWEKRNMLNSLLETQTNESPAFEANIAERADAIAGLLANPFIREPALNSSHRLEAVRRHRQLPRVEDFTSGAWEYQVLDVAGQAALLDAENELRVLKDGVFLDHHIFTRQTRVHPKDKKQSLEHVAWADAVKDTPEKQAADYW